MSNETTSQDGDVLAWLGAAISAREDVARAADAINPSPWTAGRTEDTSVTHIALNDPESVLRRCAADRKLLARHTPHHSEPAGGLICAHDQHRWPCPDITDLAEGYGWTEGER